LANRVRPQKSRIFYTTPKKEKEIGVITKNIVPKAVANRIPVFVRIAARPNANRTRARTLTSAQFYSYLALNWQWTAATVRNTSRDRRFPTPQPTTRHLVSFCYRGSAAFLLRIWRPNFEFLAAEDVPSAEGGGGEKPGLSSPEPCIGRLSQKFYSKARLSGRPSCAKKSARRGRHTGPAPSP
jgi:hypothetical protein